jgi:hypothetical protein
MVEIGKFVHTSTGKILMSIILGLGIAALFRKACKNKRCILFKAPPLEELKDKIYKFDNKCYTYTTKQTKCDKNKKIVHFA